MNLKPDKANESLENTNILTNVVLFSQIHKKLFNFNFFHLQKKGLH